MQKRERRIIKAEKQDKKRRMDEAKGFLRVRDVNDQAEESSSAYHSSNSDPESESSQKKEEELEEIFDMNEAQVHAMLAEAVANDGNIGADLQAFDLHKTPDMSDKQRIRCLLMVQLFFASLGDPQ